MNINLDTIILFVQNVEQLKVFYTDIFKLEVLEDYAPEWVLLKAGNGKIGLHKIGEQYLDKNKAAFKVDSNCKMVFEIEEDIHQLRERLLQQNVLIREIKTFDNYEYLLCDGEDPQGNVFQLKKKVMN